MAETKPESPGRAASPLSHLFSPSLSYMRSCVSELRWCSMKVLIRQPLDLGFPSCQSYRKAFFVLYNLPYLDILLQHHKNQSNKPFFENLSLQRRFSGHTGFIFSSVIYTFFFFPHARHISSYQSALPPHSWDPRPPTCSSGNAKH